MAVVAALACGAPEDSARPDEGRSTITIEPTPTLVLGELDGPPEYIFSRIEGARLLPNGRLAVADGSSGTVRIFTEDGTLENQFGGQGQGPGEFEYITHLLVLPPDTVLVYDSQALRLTSFLVNGQMLGTVSFEASDGWPEVYHGRYSDGGHAISWIQQTERDRTRVTPDLMRVARFDSSGRLLNELAESPGMRRLRNPVPFSAHFLGTVVRDTLFYTDGLNGLVSAVSPTGQPVRTFSLPLQRMSVEEAWASLYAELDSVGRDQLTEYEGVPGADSVPVVSELLDDPAGQLWFKKYDPSGDSHWLSRRRAGGTWVVSDIDGSLVTRVAPPDGLRLLDVGSDRVVGVTRDELGVERIQVHRLVGG